MDVGDESTEFRYVLQPLLIASVIRPQRPLMLFSSDVLMGCGASTVGCLDLGCREFPPCELMRAGWTRFPGPMAWRAGERAAL